ncbi:MAG TPA: hypothetical protein VK750_07720, partial [Cytophagaceae bacterium]|nr:hypothetical protein [Cytophagaceae bacterium]
MEKLRPQNGFQILKGMVKAISCLTLFLSLYMPSYAEGTRELAPTAADFNKGDMHIFDVQGGVSRDFMTYIAVPDHRLNVEICNPGEVIYFGFNYNAADITGCNKLWFRIRDPLGNIVYGPQQVTNAGAGSISSYTKAYNGPNNLQPMAGYTPALGYTPLSYTPLMLGSYYIEFNPNDPNNFINTAANCTGSIHAVRLPAFDMTVADGPNGNRINGRLWSKAWDLITNSFTNAFNGT